EELGLGANLVGKKVHIVDGQQVQLADLLPECINRVRSDRRDVLIRKLFARHIADLVRATGGLNEPLADALKQVRLSYAAIAMNEQRRDASCIGVLGEPARG